MIFWSWQSDTPKDIGRFFVRDALREAIQTLKTDEDLLEPVEREVAARLEHRDSDRQGVPGSPDLAATIFEKIEAADVFLADVTLVGETPDGKKLINSNVAIEYGHAHHALTFRRVLMVQNNHYGDGDALPFDLRQKSWPLQFMLAPGASNGSDQGRAGEAQGAIHCGFASLSHDDRGATRRRTKEDTFCSQQSRLFLTGTKSSRGTMHRGPMLSSTGLTSRKRSIFGLSRRLRALRH